MATTAWIAKSRKAPKFSTRQRNRCQVCGRPRAFYRDFGLCRLCLRKMAHEGLIPGMRKSSW
jgi:small subunit ribosomal protein S14